MKIYSQMKPAALFVLLPFVLAGCNETSVDPTRQLKTERLTLDIFCSGGGEATVLLLPALSGKSSNWEGVMSGLSPFSEVCALDFIPNDELVTGSDIARAIPSALPQEIKSRGVILVAHSFGGYIARLFYHLAPERITGVVLVEASHPDMMTAYQPLVSVESYRTMQDFVDSDPNNIDLIETEKSVREVGGFGATPLVVLSRGRPSQIKGLSAIENRKVNEAWAALQLDLMGLSSNSEQRIAHEAGHNVPLDEPQAVVDAVRRVFAMTNSSAPGANLPLD